MMAKNFVNFSQQGGDNKKPSTLRAEMPFIYDDKMHDKLVCHVIDRMKLAKQMRDARIDRYARIDRQLFSQPRPRKGTSPDEDNSEFQRLQDLEAGISVKPVDRNFGFAQDQLEDTEAQFIAMIAPDNGIFSAIAPAATQNAANALVAHLNNSAVRGNYYENLFLFVRSSLRYNFAAMSVFWEEHKGRLLRANAGGVVQPDYGVTWRGNILQHHDPYNFFFDVSVTPTELSRKGEFYAWVDTITGFSAKRAEEQKKMYWTSRFVEGMGADKRYTCEFYKEPPHTSETEKNTADDWISVLSAGAESSVGDSIPALEVIHYVGWIDPKEFGSLAPTGSIPGSMQLWRFDIVNGMYLANAVQLQDAHGMLPVVCSVPNPDVMKRRLPALSEKLLPLSQFASFALNSHQAGVRKALGGITLYDPTRIPFGSLPKGDLIAAKIAVRTSTNSPSVDSGFKQIVDVPQTGDYMNQVGSILQLMQRAAPTDFNNQMATLERATRYQAAAVAQGLNKRNLVSVKLIYDQGLGPMVMMMANNVIVNLPQLSYIDETTKAPTTVMTSSLIGQDVEYTVGTGIRGIDRLMLIETYKELLNYISQNPQAVQRIDIVRLLDYVSTLSGDDTNLAQFELSQQQQQQLMAAQNAAASQGQGQGSGVSPANAPAAPQPTVPSGMPQNPQAPGIAPAMAPASTF